MSLSGEWWIDDGGQATYADGDVGDMNHEGIAFQAALGISEDDIPGKYAPKFEIERVLEAIQEVMDEKKEEGEEFDFTPEEVLDDLRMGVAGSLGDRQVIGMLALGANADAVDYFSNPSSDARMYMVEKHAWIRVAANRFQMLDFDDDALGRIRGFVGDEYPEDEDPLEDEFEIEELRPKGMHLTLTGAELLESGKSAAELKHGARRERTGMYNPLRGERQEKLPGTQAVSSRISNAEERFITSVMEQFGFTRQEAWRILDTYVRYKAVKLDPIMSRFDLKDGRFWDREVMQRALESK